MSSSSTQTSTMLQGQGGPHFAPAAAPRRRPVVSVVVPVYNESATIVTVVERLAAVPLDMEIILVDDASTDGTRGKILQMSEDLPLRMILKPSNEGKGAAIRTGLAHCRGDIVVIQDADLEYDPREIPRLIEGISCGDADVVYGSRFLIPSSRDSRGIRWLHCWLNRTLTWISNRFTGLRLTDMETCYKAVRREALSDVTLEQNRFGFEPEITAKLARKKLRFTEIPISYAPRGYREGKKIKPFDLVNAVYSIVRYSRAA